MQTHQYRNGLKLVFEKIKSNTPITYMILYCKVGSIHEPESLRGISHFIEHMCFEGTTHLKKGVDVYIDFEKNGASFNASTEKTNTSYYVKCIADSTEKCMSTLSDIVLNPTFNKKECVREESVVIEEVKTDLDDTSSYILAKIDELLYKGTPLEHHVDHYKYHRKKHASFDYEDMMDYYHFFYQPHNMVLSICSTLSFAEIKKIVNKTYFISQKPQYIPKQSLSPSPLLKYAFLPTVPEQEGIRLDVVEKPGHAKTDIAIGFRVCNRYSKDVPVLEILEYIFNGFSGRLFVALRETYGVSYSSDTYTTFYENTGDFTFSTNVDKSRVTNQKGKRGALSIFIDILNGLLSGKSPVTQEELDKVKHYIYGDFAISEDYIEDNTEHNGLYHLYESPKKMIPFRDLYKCKYEPITVDQIQDVVKRYFRKDSMCVCIIGSSISKEAVEKECMKLLQ